MTRAADELEAAARGIRRCTSCRLHEGRRHAVPGEGPADARVMLVGEAPGVREDRQGTPFVGTSGKYLDEALADIGIERGSLFITSSVKCRPPNNRDPRVDEIETCTGRWLFRQIDVVDPILVVVMGRAAARGVLGETGRLADLRGQLRETDGRLWGVTFHPAAGMRFPDKDEFLRRDLRSFLGAING